jgi:hypothetical protein
MADNFDLKKFLTESKALENLNPVIAKENLSENDIRSKIREMVLAELSEEKDLEEAKKKKDEEVEDVEVTDTEIEDIPAEDEMPVGDISTDSGLEDVAANMEGTESEVMDHLMSALKIAKGMNNEKLTTQIGNTLKFFVSEYIGGGEQ